MNDIVLELAGILKEKDKDAFWECIFATLRNYGFTSMLYGLMLNRRDVEVSGYSRSTFWKCNYPQSYFDVFPRETFLENEISLLRVVESYLPTVWHDERAWNYHDSPEQHRRGIIERELGFEVGLSVPLQLSEGGRSVSGVGMCAHELSPQEFSLMWRDKSSEILPILQMLDVGMRQEHIAGMIALSPREKDCLSWLVAGLRPDQIADRLHISPKSLEKYISSAKRKLKVSIGTEI